MAGGELTVHSLQFTPRKAACCDPILVSGVWRLASGIYFSRKCLIIDDTVPIAPALMPSGMMMSA